MFEREIRVIVQGITGKQGRFHTKLMKEYGTRIVGGVTPGKGGQTIEGFPVFDTVAECLDNEKADFSVIFVPARFAKDAALEALNANLNLVIITEGIPILDTLEIVKRAKERNLVVIGPNTPGFVKVGVTKLGIMPGNIFNKGDVGVVSRSGTLTYEVVNKLSEGGIGQHVVVGIGGDKVVGLGFNEVLEMFERDDQIKRIVIIGEIGSEKEEKAAEFIKNNITKKVVVFIAGKTAPKGKKMGHAGAIIMGNKGTFESKVRAFESAGIKVDRTIDDIVDSLKKRC
jgi:succinyl-CoA synthetase alpha subunit